MNNEIKEILNEMKDICNVWVKVGGDMKSYNQDQMHCIYDYITNLQQENNNLKTSLDESQEVVIDLQQENERLKEENKDNEQLIETQLRGLEKQKQIIEKAVEYIKENAKYKKVSINNSKYYSEYLINQVLDILNGSDE